MGDMISGSRHHIVLSLAITFECHLFDDGRSQYEIVRLILDDTGPMPLSEVVNNDTPNEISSAIWADLYHLQNQHIRQVITG
jgi:hypothetical protein